MAGPRVPPPPRALPLVYFAVAHLALAWALWIPATEPEAISGFFFHPKMFFVVHLITLGWVTSSIFGATYIVGPLALRMPMRARTLDWLVCMGLFIGSAGVVAHFWMNEYSGVAWSGGVLALLFALMLGRVVRALRRSGSPPAVRLHVLLAYTNLLFAAILGTLLAINRQRTILPGSHLTDVFGHVHLAIVGWGALMVMGVGYRLIPMFLPAAPPEGRMVWASVLLPEVGVFGMAWSFLYKRSLVAWCAVCIAAGLIAFLWNVVRMLRDPRPPPVQLPRPDVGTLHTLQAVFYLLVCTGLGLFLAFSGKWHTGWIMAYGVFALLGFLAQIVLGIGMRLVPMFAWTEAWVAGGYERLPPSPHQMPARPLQFAVFLCWTAGVPMLAWGLGCDRRTMVSAGAWILLSGVVCAAANTARVASRAYPR